MHRIGGRLGWLVMNNYGPDTWNGSIHVEVPDTFSAAQLDQLIRQIQVKVMQEHHVVLTAVGVYSVNTRDEEVIRTRQRVHDIVLAHKGVKQIHGFYLIREEKTIRFDLVVSFDAGDRRKTFEEAVADVQKASAPCTVTGITAITVITGITAITADTALSLSSPIRWSGTGCCRMRSACSARRRACCSPCPMGIPPTLRCRPPWTT